MFDRALKRIVLDAGHGGSDPGTIANGIVEKDYTLKITDYIHNRLNQLGIPNETSRESDVTLDPTARPARIQSFYGNGSDVLVVSSHINAGGGDGAEVIYALRNNDTFSKKIANELENAGQNVRKYYQRRLPSNPSKDYYYLMRNTPNNETVIVEYGFADSKGDDVSLLKNRWQDLAEAVTKAIAEYAGYTYYAPLGSDYYTVKSGDSLWSISKKYGITVDELKNANNLKGNLLSVGQNLIIPSLIEEKEEYIVEKGDTLYSIANKFNTTVDNLKSINKLVTDALAIGQIIKLPASLEDNEEEEATPDLTTYIVKSGDNLYAIANKYNTTVDEIKRLNNLKSNILSIGEVLNVPAIQEEVEEPEIIPPEISDNTYVVKSGDTLYKIALENNTTVDDLKNLNNLTNNTLSIGQVLNLPTKVENQIYIVKAGDTLYSIAREFGVSVDDIINLNNLDTIVLSIGEQLLIP